VPKYRWAVLGWIDQPRPCAYADVDPAEPVGVACGAAPERTQFEQVAERVRDIAKALLGPTSVDEVWVECIKNQTLPEPNDNFNVT
jgi:hypothetical protein